MASAVVSARECSMDKKPLLTLIRKVSNYSQINHHLRAIFLYANLLTFISLLFLPTTYLI